MHEYNKFEGPIELGVGRCLMPDVDDAVAFHPKSVKAVSCQGVHTQETSPMN
jgi:hypothetical protein